MRTTVKNTKLVIAIIINILIKTPLTNNADVCEQGVRIAENKFA